MRKFSARNGQNFAKKKLQIVGPEALGAGKKLGRVNHVRRALRVTYTARRGILAHTASPVMLAHAWFQVDLFFLCRQKNASRSPTPIATGLELPVAKYRAWSPGRGR